MMFKEILSASIFKIFAQKQNHITSIAHMMYNFMCYGGLMKGSESSDFIH